MILQSLENTFSLDALHLQIAPVQNHKHLIVGNTAKRKSAIVNTSVMLWFFHQGIYNTANNMT